MTFTICLIPGDGVGQEVIPATAYVLQALDASLEFVYTEAGFGCFEACGDALPPETLTTVQASDAALFGATSSPSTRMKGYRSPILSLRKTLDLYANLRPVISLPGEFSRQGVDFLIVRENTEGLYSGRERREGNIAVSERVITREASLRIAKSACDLACERAIDRQRHPQLTVVHKANVLKQTCGLFRESVLEVAGAYPALSVNELLVDAAAMRLALSPEDFDVIVTSNLFGDILSDLGCALVGGLGVAPSANVGAKQNTPVFEPVHGSAPDIAGKGIANPTGAMLAASMLLEYIALPEAARQLREAILDTLGAGVKTPDIGGTATTSQVAEAVRTRIRPLDKLSIIY